MTVRVALLRIALLALLNIFLLVDVPVTILSVMNRLSPVPEIELVAQILAYVAINWLSFKGRYIASVALLYSSIAIGSLGSDLDDVLLKGTNEYLFLVIVPLAVFLISFAFSRMKSGQTTNH